MSSSSDSDDSDAGEQIRVALTLASEVNDRSLEVPTESIAVPASVGRKGLAAVVNHLLDRNVGGEEDEGSDDDEDDDNKLPALPFDFVFQDNHRMLRTGVEREARRYGLSLEKPLQILYFPAQEAPELEGESEKLPDWISCLQYQVAGTGTEGVPFLCAASYDGSLRIYRPSQEHHREKEESSVTLTPVASSLKAHSGPIKCLSVVQDNHKNSNLLLASGSMDHSLVVHSFDPETNKLHKEHECQHGHADAIGCVDLFPNRTLASGDWDGTLCLWDLKDDNGLEDAEDQQASKKAKTGDKSSSKKKGHSIKPKVLLNQAHVSQISGCSWGNLHKKSTSSANSNAHNTLITGSWDHSVKTWDMERQECVLSLNGSRVVACLDTSHHSDGIVATGHPDCSVRLWDLRTSKEASSSVVSDKTFRPSHKEWVSAVQWSPRSPYHLASTSHDGTVKVWDIRSSIPLHTVRVFPKSEKGLCMAYGEHADSGTDINSSGGILASLFLGGTDCVVKQFVTANG